MSEFVTAVDVHSALREVLQARSFKEWRNPFTFDSIPESVADRSARIMPTSTGMVTASHSCVSVDSQWVVVIRTRVGEFTRNEKLANAVLIEQDELIDAFLSIEVGDSMVSALVITYELSQDEQYVDATYTLGLEYSRKRTPRVT